MSIKTAVSQIEEKVHFIRGHRVMFAHDLAVLYGVRTKRLNEQVRRNPKRFPSDFAFQLTMEEFKNLRSQFATSSWGGSRYQPLVFTEQGVAMLSSVLNSERAINTNVAIMRAFVKLRSMALGDAHLSKKLDELEKQVQSHDGHIRLIFESIRGLIRQPELKKKRIGFSAA